MKENSENTVRTFYCQNLLKICFFRFRSIRATLSSSLVISFSVSVPSGLSATRASLVSPSVTFIPGVGFIACSVADPTITDEWIPPPWFDVTKIRDPKLRERCVVHRLTPVALYGNPGENARDWG